MGGYGWLPLCRNKNIGFITGQGCTPPKILSYTYIPFSAATRFMGVIATS